jgi:UDP-N-acetylglucosamine 2-epimerase (non-hydrolysing)
LKNLCGALVDLTHAYPDIQIAFPLIFDAEVRNTVFGILKNKERIHLLDRLPYDAFVEAMGRAHMIITDSGCIMDEGLALKKPVLLFKDPKDIIEESAGEGVLSVGLKRENLVVETSRLLEDPDAYKNMICGIKAHADGHAAERILQAIRYHFNIGSERPKDFQSPESAISTEDKKVIIKPMTATGFTQLSR